VLIDIVDHERKGEKKEGDRWARLQISARAREAMDRHGIKGGGQYQSNNPVMQAMVKQAAEELRFPSEVLGSMKVSQLGDRISSFFDNINKQSLASKGKSQTPNSEERLNKLAELVLGDPDHGFHSDKLTMGLEDFFRCHDQEAKRLYMEFMKNGLIKDLFIKILAKIYSFPKPPVSVPFGYFRPRRQFNSTIRRTTTRR
jgi:hypothetical protein